MRFLILSCVVAWSSLAAADPLTVASGGQVDPRCFNVGTGSATVVASGGTPPYFYSWAPSGGTGATAVSLFGGVTYTVTVTDSTGQSAEQHFMLSQPPPLVLTGSQVDIACRGASTGSATVVASGGSGGYTYQWSPSGGHAAGASGLAAGPYSVTVTDANNCTASKAFTLAQPATALSVTPSHVDVSCHGGTNGSASVSVAGGVPGYTYQWSPSGGAAATASGLGAGAYTVNITDAAGCAKTADVTVVEPPALVADVTTPPVTCHDSYVGQASVQASGGAGAYQYSWSPAGGTGATAAGLVPGDYTVTVTDLNSCTTTGSITLVQPPELVVAKANETDVSCYGAHDGSAGVTVNGGAGGYAYDWTVDASDVAAISGLDAGPLAVTVTDTRGCSRTQAFDISQPPEIQLSAAAQSDVRCFGGADGSASANPATGGVGDFTYTWTPAMPEGALALDALTAGTYTLTATDETSCAKSLVFEIAEPPPLLAGGSAQSPSVFDACDGSASVAPSGGVGLYTVSWAPSGATTFDLPALCEGAVEATVTDVNGCTATYQANLSAPNRDLGLTLAGPSDALRAGAHVDLTATIATAPAAASAVVSVMFGPGLTITQLTPPTGWSCTPLPLATTRFTCQTAQVDTQGPQAIGIAATIDPLFGAGEIAVTAEVTSANDPVATNNHTTLALPIISPAKLRVTKTVSALDEDTLRYELTIANVGAAAAVHLDQDTLVDTLAPELALVAASATRGVMQARAQTIAWNGALEAGASVVITLDADFTAPPGATLSNQAKVVYDADGDGVIDSEAGSSPDGGDERPTLYTVPEAPPPADHRGGGGCQSADASGSAGLLLVGLVLWSRRRRHSGGAE